MKEIKGWREKVKAAREKCVGQVRRIPFKVKGKYKPHQGREECERRRTQMAFRELRSENRGTVLTAEDG